MIALRRLSFLVLIAALSLASGVAQAQAATYFYTNTTLSLPDGGQLVGGEIFDEGLKGYTWALKRFVRRADGSLDLDPT